MSQDDTAAGPIPEREIGDVVDALRNARERSGAALLIGAGCSVGAGIPLASGFVEEIRTRFPVSYRRAPEKAYGECMRELAPDFRQELIARYVNGAKINWAHVCIAALMREGYVTRVLTTNFDNLVIRACALLGEFPAVYDLASSQAFKPSEIPPKAVFYLHGQHTGFFLKNTPEEVEAQSAALRPVFEAGGGGRPWLVAGYSGSNDPVFRQLASMGTFGKSLYWANRDAAEHVRRELLREGRYAFFVRIDDADAFFVTLARELAIFPPDFVSRPFSYLDGILETLAPLTLPGESAEAPVVERPRKWIEVAVRQFELGEAPEPEERDHAAAEGADRVLVTRILDAHLAGKYEEVLDLSA